MNRIRRIDWDAAAGVIAAVVALVLHLLHVVDEGVLLSITLVLLALMLVRDLRREDREEHTADTVEQTAASLVHLQRTLTPPDSILIGPQRLRAESERFARGARGDMIWFNVCLLMFVPQSLFDVLLRPAVENPNVTSIQFILDEGERERWQTVVLPKVAQCAGREKVWEPHWTALQESVSFILAEQALSGALEAHLSFWGEPFMARTPGHDVPRYIFHVQAHSELIARLVELQRLYRVGGRP
ncbi:MAG TPA: hypothetical protein VFE37_05665 [Chloroflexota bacterium]|nr:hypothetical protein [Chloroflexota bacterium]